MMMIHWGSNDKVRPGICASPMCNFTATGAVYGEVNTSRVDALPLVQKIRTISSFIEPAHLRLKTTTTVKV